MARIAKLVLPIALAAIASATLAFGVASRGDWLGDSWPAVHALAAGHPQAYFEAPAMMGPLATAVEAASVGLIGASGQAAFGWAALPDVLAAGLLGLYLAAIARRRGTGAVGQALIAALCVVNPLTVAALELGHPEEILTAALAVAAIAAAAEGGALATALLLGAAASTKQWAVIGAVPALMALPGRRVKVALGAAGVACVLTLPGLIASPGTFLGVQEHAATTGGVVTPWSLWYALGGSHAAVYHVGGERLVAQVHSPPALAGPVSHPLILLLALALPLLLALRWRRVRLSATEAMALFSLLLLLRCVLDPVDNLYYHEPLLLGLLGWDAFASKGLPIRGLVGAAAVLVFSHFGPGATEPAAFNALYLAAATAGAAYIASSLFRPRVWTLVPRNEIFAGLNPNSGD